MPAVTVPTVSDVVAAAAANLNDTQQAIWTNPRIMPHVKSAVNWLATQIANISTQYFTKWVGAPYTPVDIPYTSGQVDLTPQLPADLYEPESLEYRLNTSCGWAPMERATHLAANNSTLPQLLTCWEWSGRTLRVQPAQINALLRLRYLALMPGINDSGSPIPIDNCVQALAYATAAFAYAARGQTSQATAMWGSEAGPAPGGAGMYLGLVLGIIVKNEQLIPRRPVPYGSGGGNGGSGWPRP